jgi:hypothetical protein
MSPLKVALALALFATGDAFLPQSIRARSSSRLSMAGPGDVQWENTGPEWKSDSQGGNTPFQSGAADWGATDTPDFFEEDYDPDKGPQFSDGAVARTRATSYPSPRETISRAPSTMVAGRASAPRRAPARSLLLWLARAGFAARAKVSQRARPQQLPPSVTHRHRHRRDPAALKASWARRASTR